MRYICKGFIGSKEVGMFAIHILFNLLHFFGKILTYLRSFDNAGHEKC